jgi:hypothetical protein
MALSTRSGMGSVRRALLSQNQTLTGTQSQWTFNVVARNAGRQRRGVSLQALDERKGGMYAMRRNHQSSNILFIYLPTTDIPYHITRISPTNADIASSNTTRPPTRHSPRLRLGRLLSLAQPRPKQIPNRRRLPALLLRLHPPPGLHLRRNARIPLRAGTHPRPQRNQKRTPVLPGLGGWRRLRPANAANRGDG